MTEYYQRPIGRAAWRDTSPVGSAIYAADLSRFVHDQDRKRFGPGTLVVPYEHAGDCFYYYLLVERVGPCFVGFPHAPKLGSYSFGPDDLVRRLTATEWHLLAAGLSIQVEPEP